MAVAYLLLAAYFALADVGSRVLPPAPQPARAAAAEAAGQAAAVAQDSQRVAGR